MTQIHLRSSVLIAAGLVLLASVFSGAALGDDVLGGSTSFDIPAQPIRSALIEFSQQADVQIMGSSDLFGEMQSTAVKGKLRGSAALRMLLQNTGLRYEALRHAVVVRPIANARIRKDGSGIEVSPPTVEMASGSTRPIHSLVPLGEMTITGTHIRGGDPIGSQLIVMDRQALDRTGYATVQEVIRSLPQNFVGGPSEDTIHSDNVVRGTGINLRGLGVGSTLVLLNGRRLALGRATSSFVDISSIPLTAVARDLRRLGGGNFSSVQSNPGTVNIGGRQYAIPRNQDGTALTPDAFVPDTVNWQNQNQDRDLYGRWWRHSGFFSVAHSLGDGSFTNSATLARIRRSTLFASDSDVTGFNLIANGGLLSLPAGEMRLAAGADYREQVFQSHTRGREATAVTVSPRFERNVGAAFAELLVPIVSHANRMPGVEMAQVSLAARYDRYDDFGSTFNPRFGAQWSPLDGIVVHGAWGKSFKAPNLPDLDESQVTSYIVSLPDPQSPTGTSPVLAWLGENRDLKPETATTWSAGIKWSPGLAWNPSFDLTFFTIHFKERIQSAPLIDSFLADPVRFAGIVTRNPTPAQRANVCSRGDYLGNFGTTPGDCLSAPIAAIVDARLNNTLESNTRGLDLLGTMDVDSDWGRFGFNSNVSYVLEFSEAQTPTVAAVSLVDTVGNPLRFKMRDSVSWNLDELGAMVSVNYAGSYRDNVSVPHRRVGSWTTLDLNLSYAVDVDMPGWLSGCTVSLNVQNLFDTDPPFVNNSAGVGYDRENADLLKRFVSLRVQKSW